MQDRDIKLLPEVLRNLVLESIKHRVAQRAGRDHGVRTACLGRQDVLAGQFDRDFFVVGCGVKAAAFIAPAVIDRLATEHLGELLGQLLEGTKGTGR